MGVVTKNYPEYSFGPKNSSTTAPPRMHYSIPKTGTPRHVGPGSHSPPTCVGGQVSSEKKSAPSWSFGSKPTPRVIMGDRQFPQLDPSPELSSIGNQVVSSARSAPSCGFGTSTREHSARTFLVVTESDRGPAGKMPAHKFHLEMPPPGKKLPKPGL